MNLGIFLALGDSFKSLSRAGQDELFKNFYLKAFSRGFGKVYIFTYENEKIRDLPNNVIVIPNKFRLHRYVYALVSPFLNMRYINECNIFRGYHLSSTVPLIVIRVFFRKPFIFNLAYDYKKFALIDRKYIQWILFSVLEPIAYKYSSKIFIANLRLLADKVTDKSVYLPNGVDINFFQPGKVKKNALPHILSVGRLERQKNFENLITGLSSVNANLTIVGNGTRERRLVLLAKKNKVNLKIIKKVNHSQMPKIYSESDIFVLPSLIEGHPKVLLEAMSSGLPVIVSKTEGIVDIVNGRNGILVDPNPNSITKAILEIISHDGVRSKLSHLARITIEKKFDLTKLLNTEIKTIKSIA